MAEIQALNVAHLGYNVWGTFEIPWRVVKQNGDC
jgi:hypothetical protein